MGRGGGVNWKYWSKMRKKPQVFITKKEILSNATEMLSWLSMVSCPKITSGGWRLLSK